MKNRLLLKCLIGAMCVGVGQAEAQESEPMSRFIASHGDSVWVRHYPATGPSISSSAVLLLPGWPAVGGDVLGIGSALSAMGVHVFVMHPRGHGESTGEATFASAIDDVAVVWEWLSSREGGVASGIDPKRRHLAGYSWGGGIAMAFAARQPSVKRVASIAGSDHGVFIRRFDEDPEYAALYRRGLASTQAPEGPVRFTLDAALEELRTTHAEHDLVTLAPRLSDRDILILAGWDDEEVEIEFQVLPFYRALQTSGAGSVRLVAFQDGHAFRESRQALVGELYAWIHSESEGQRH